MRKVESKQQIKDEHISVFETLKRNGSSLVAQMAKGLPTAWETQVQSLDWEDPVEKEMATHSSTLAWRIPWTEEPGGLLSMGSQRVIFAKVESLSHVQLFTTSWTAAYQARVLEWGAIAFSAWWD